MIIGRRLGQDLQIVHRHGESLQQRQRVRLGVEGVGVARLGLPVARPGKADAQSGAIVSYGDILLEEDSRSVTVAGKPVALTAKEFDLLWLLASHPGRVFTRSQLLDRVWSQDYAGLDNTVKSHINRLRSKIEPDPSHPIYVMTAWGVGYCFGPERRG